MLGKACPEKAGELKQDYEQRLRTHNVTPEILEIGPTPELTKRDAKIVREIVRSNLRYDQNALDQKWDGVSGLRRLFHSDRGGRVPASYY